MSGKSAVLSLTIPVAPMPAHRPRVDRGRAHDTAKYAAWKDEVRWCFKGDRPKFKTGHLVVDTTFYVKNIDGVRGDVDNYVKSLFDAGNGFVWTDDKQVIEVHARLRTAPKTGPFITMSVWLDDHEGSVN